MKEPKWRRFERLVAKIQSDLAPSAVVKHNEKVQGRSGALRQVDVCIRRQVGQFPLLIALECKDLQRSVTVKHVEEFSGLLEDIGANKGGIVASNGFTKAAVERARAAGIDVFTLVDTGSHDWRVYVSVPILFHDLSLAGFRVSFRFKGIVPAGSLSRDLSEAAMFNPEGVLVGSPEQLLLDSWRSGHLPSASGHFKGVKVSDGSLFLKLDGRFYPVDVLAEVWIEAASYFGSVPLEKISGLKNEVTGAVSSRGFATEYLNFSDLKKAFLKVRDPKDLAVRPVLELEIQTVGGTGSREEKR